VPKKIPYAVANYEKIVDEGFHFVDKTRFIRELENYQVPIFLRPRRFGKSLWCSVLECYYDTNRKDRFDTLFGHTDIGRDPTPSRNSQMVMRFDLSKIEVLPSYQTLREKFNNECENTFEVFLGDYGTFFEGFTGPASGDASDVLARILRAVRKADAPPLHIIIDEYDNFTNQLLTTHQDGLYHELTTGDSFLRTFYKVIKAGVGEGTVARVFITGVLPITMDDLTSGFNIGQIITLEEHTLEMMGFTQAEVDAYVDEIFAEHGWSEEKRKKVGDELRVNYNGYRLLPNAAEPLYNSTICNYYLSKLVIGGGKLPTETIDENLRVDVNWLRRLTGSDEDTRELLEQLMFEGTLPADVTMLRSKFNMSQFFQKPFYPLSLYYLGMLTFRDRFSLTFPNLTVKTIFTEYFNEVERITVSLGYTDMFQRFLDDHDLEALFAGYWKQYVGQIPAQAFDKANENFFRTTFFELCTRYLSPDLMFAIEVNHPSGRSDWEAVGRTGTPFENEAFMIEFKHFARTEGERLGVSAWAKPNDEDVEQVTRYAGDLKCRYPELSVRRHVLYTVGAADYRFFTLD